MIQLLKRIGVGLVGFGCIVLILVLAVMVLLGFPSMLYHINPHYELIYYSVLVVIGVIAAAYFLGGTYYEN